MRYFFLILSSIVSVQLLAQLPEPTGWTEAQALRKGNLNIYWYESRPFIFKNKYGEIDGVEKELMDDFRLFVLEKYRVDIKIHWEEDRDFQRLIPNINRSSGGTMGCSAISITEQRKEVVDFAPPYMPDISVLITSKNVPVLENEVSFDDIASQLTAVTIKGTTYEQDLKNLQQERNLFFNYRFIPSSDNIQSTIRDMNSAFGFIDLPIYLMELQRNAGHSVNRQNLFSQKREGYAFILPKGSDWSEPLREYFTSDRFKTKMSEISGKYFDKNLYQFIERLTKNSNDDLVLLNKEKEIQEARLAGKDRELREQNTLRNFLFVTVGLSITVLISLFILYQKTNHANQQLSEQKAKIEAQGENIETQNKQLELKANRLIHLNEEKNNLIKILAHDLRSPINQVQGLAQVFLLQNKDLPADQLDLIHKIIDSSIRLNSMIGKILDVDAIESNRVNLIWEEIAVNVVAKKVLGSFEKQATTKNIRLQLVANAERIRFKGDMLFFTEVLENLLSNAIKFSPAGTLVILALHQDEVGVTLSVKDQGPGLEESDFNKLFEKYQRLSARPTGGENSTGLGLSIVRKYVELMQGRVWAESERGQGATFYVRFPHIDSKG